MITGYVSRFLEPIVPIGVLDRNGHLWRLEVVVDTGFDGDLTLPLERINELGLAWAGQREMVLADGRDIWCAYYAARVLWDGEYRTAQVMESESEYLLGNNLLAGRLLTVEMVAGGVVTIEELPAGQGTGRLAR